MRKFLRNLWLISGDVMTAFMSLISVWLFSSRKVAQRLRKLTEGVDTSRKVFVLGNGPSLQDILNNPQLFRELKENDVIVCNNFSLSDNFWKLRPCYYILLDPCFYKKEEISKNTTIQKMYEALNKVDWPLYLFLTSNTNLNVVNEYLHNAQVTICLYNATTIIGPVRFQNRMFSRGLGIPNSRNVILPAITLMINYGYKNVYLYGAEFSWIKNFDIDEETGKIYLNDGHFYQKKNIIYNDPDYPYEKGYYRFSLEMIAKMLRGTESLAIYAESRGVKVVNRTKGSYIDAFEYENPDMC